MTKTQSKKAKKAKRARQEERCEGEFKLRQEKLYQEARAAGLSPGNYAMMRAMQRLLG